MPISINVRIGDEAAVQLDAIQAAVGRNRAEAVEQAILSVDPRKCGRDYHARCIEQLDAATEGTSQ